MTRLAQSPRDAAVPALLAGISSTGRQNGGIGRTIHNHSEVGVVWLLAATAVAVGATSDYAAHAAALLMVFVLMSQGWNIISGYGGPLALGQAAYFGIADFFTILMFQKYGISQYWGAAIGISVALLLALVVGGFTLRRPTFLFAIASILVPLIVQAFIEFLGYYEVERPYLVNANPGMFWFPGSFIYLSIAAILVAIAGLGTSFMAKGRFGRFLIANRENSRAAESSGVPTYRYKLYAYLIAAGLAAVAGVLYGQLTYVFDPTDAFDPSQSVEALLLTLVGGAGTVAGPMLGGALVVPIQYVLRTYVQQAPGLDIVVYSAVLVVIAMWFPRGAVPSFAMAIRAVRRGAADGKFRIRGR